MYVSSTTHATAVLPHGQAPRAKAPPERASAAPQESTKVAISERSWQALAASQSGGDARHDFSRMTPNEMKAVSKDLYESGEIDLTQLRILGVIGMPLGRMSRGGELVQFTPQEREFFEDHPVNYPGILQSMIRSARASMSNPDGVETVRFLTELQSILRAHQK